MENKLHGGTYFAAMNTASGFKSYFSEIFGDLERLYIIKGGPGTGKSRLMRELSEKAKEKGYETEEFLCSSDPMSLDGIIIPELSLGVLDGTPPHACEPVLPGAKDNILDLGQFWDSDKLAARRDEIKALNSAKRRLYDSVYGYLNAVREYDRICLAMTEKALDMKKLERAVMRAADALGSGDGAIHTIRIRGAVSCEGILTLCTFAGIASKRFALLDAGCSAGIFMKRLLAETDKRGCPAVVSYEPFHSDVPDAVYYPGSDTVYYIGSESDYDEKNVNMRRFLDNSVLSPFKPRQRAIQRLRSAVLKELVTDYRCIKRLHTEVEKIYSDAMNFAEKERFSSEFIGAVLGD